MDQKLNVLQQILDDITEDSGFYGSIISSEEGLLIINSNQIDPKIEIESLVAKAASIFNEKSLLFDNLEYITIGYPNRKLFIQKVSFFNNSENSLFLITILPSNLRYFRRKVNKIVKEVCSIIS